MKKLKKIAVLSTALLMTSCIGMGMPNIPQMNTVVYAESDYAVYNEFEYIVDSRNNVHIMGYQGNAANVTIPARINGNKVVYIGEKVFANNSTLKTVAIPASVEEIGDYAFVNCSSLQSIRLPDSVKVLGFSVFANCDSLKSVKLSKNLAVLPMYTFRRCMSLEKIQFPDGMQSIRENAFEYCEKLQEVTLTCNTVLGAFQDCHNLKKVTVTEGCTSIGTYTFKDCWSLTEITIADSVVQMGERCFEGCERLAVVSLPSHLKAISEGMFKDCTLLRSVTCGNEITSIGRYAFYQNSNLLAFAFPPEVTYIGSSAFAKSGISNVSLGKKVRTIDSGAFAECQNLKTVYLPDSISCMQSGAFQGCKNLTFFKLSAGLYRIDDATFADCIRLSTIQGGANIGQVGYHAFYNCYALKKVEVARNAQINASAFENCYCTLYSYNNGNAKAFARNHDMPFFVMLENLTAVNAEKEILIGSSIDLTFDADGGYGDYQYMVNYKKSTDKKYTVLQSYRESTGLHFTPKTVGEYEINVYVRDAKRNTVKKTFIVSVKNPLKNTSSVSSVNVTTADTVTLNVSSTGGIGKVMYKYEQSDANYNYTTPQKNYYDTDKFTLTFPKAGKYIVIVYAKDENGTVVKKQFNITVKYVLPTNTSSLSASTVKFGDTIQFNLSGKGGQSPYQYKITYRKKGDTAWKTVQEYYPRSYYRNFKLTSLGEYEFCIKLKDDVGNISRKNFTLRVTM